MSRPEQTFSRKGSGVKLVHWGKGKFSIEKNYFKKEGDSGQWVKSSTFFDKDLLILSELINEAIQEKPEVNMLDSLPKASNYGSANYEDDAEF